MISPAFRTTWRQRGRRVAVSHGRNPTRCLPVRREVAWSVPVFPLLGEAGRFRRSAHKSVHSAVLQSSPVQDSSECNRRVWARVDGLRFPESLIPSEQISRAVPLSAASCRNLWTRVTPFRDPLDISKFFVFRMILFYFSCGSGGCTACCAASCAFFPMRSGFPLRVIGEKK